MTSHDSSGWKSLLCCVAGGETLRYIMKAFDSSHCPFDWSVAC